MAQIREFRILLQGSHSDLETWENLEKATFFVQNLENGGLGQLTAW